VKKLATPVTLAAIKADAAFKDFALVRISRLSVMPVSDAEWKRIETLADSGHVGVDDRRQVERDQLRDDQAADDGKSERPARFPAGAEAERDRRAPSSAAIVVIMIGRKRIRQPS